MPGEGGHDEAGRNRETDNALRRRGERPEGSGWVSRPEASAAEVTEAEAAAAVEADLAGLQNERDDLRSTLQQVQADFENYRKRMLREQTALVERATEGLVEQLLPVLDSLEAALVAIDPDDKVRKGVELVYAELLGVLEKAGLSRIEATGKPFDPAEHEAVMQDDGDGEPVVREVVRTGYRLKGRVLRPAMVAVAR
ncbi:MAG: nucleotide exchange factor GrpE [Acidimicrobiia bacterium]